MIVHNEFEQGSVEWMEARAGIPTASEFDQLVTPKFARRTGQMPHSYLARKLAEFWLGGPLLGHSSFSTEQGQILEREAKACFVFESGIEVQNVGFITTDDGRVGCSPDGLIGEEGGLEFKCPEPQTHCKYLLAGVVPEDYIVQVHGALYVTGRKWWKFVSYRRHFPTLTITVERDESIMEALDESLKLFLGMFDRSLEYFEQLNGGPSANRARVQRAREMAKREPVQFSWEQRPDFVP